METGPFNVEAVETTPTRREGEKVDAKVEDGHGYCGKIAAERTT
jgi:hypothetical protein